MVCVCLRASLPAASSPGHDENGQSIWASPLHLVTEMPHWRTTRTPATIAHTTGYRDIWGMVVERNGVGEGVWVPVPCLRVRQQASAVVWDQKLFEFGYLIGWNFGKSFSGRKRNRRHVAGATRFLRSCPIIQRVPDVLNRSPISFQTPHRVRFNEKDPFSARKLCPLETKRRDHSTSLSTDTVMPTISTVKTDKPAERERERDRDNYHGKASNRVRPKINRKNTSTATSFTPPLRNRDHRCRIRIPSVAGGYLCVALSIEPPPASFHPTLHAGGERRSKEPR